MAVTVTFISSQRNAGIVVDFYNFTASGSGDTYALVVSGRLISAEFFDANGNSIVSSPPTVGTVSAGTVPGTNTATITANSGGVVTNGAMAITHCGL